MFSLPEAWSIRPINPLEHLLVLSLLWTPGLPWQQEPEECCPTAGPHSRKLTLGEGCGDTGISQDSRL